MTVAPTRERVRANEGVYAELHEFLDDETAVLDHDRTAEWLGMLAEDLAYRRRSG